MSQEFRVPPYGGLTPAELELLAVLAEECSETAQATMKIIRFGKEGCAGYSNVEKLEIELGNVHAAMRMLVYNGLICRAKILKHAEDKLVWIRDHKILHHADAPIVTRL